MADTRHIQEEAMGALREAATTGNATSLNQLLQVHRITLHRFIVESNTETLLHIAALLGHNDCVREILHHYPKLALELDHNRCSPLHLASGKGHVDIVKMLLKSQPLWAKDMCKLLDEEGRIPAHIAAVKGRTEVLIELLSVSPESVQIKNRRRETILHLAVKHNQLATLTLLSAYQEIPRLLNSQDIDGNTILHIAVADKQAETVKYLIRGNIGDVKVNIQNNNWLTPLDVLLQSRSDRRDMEIAKVLQYKGAATGSDPLVTTRMLNNNNNDTYVKNMESALMLLASIIDTVAFQAGFSPAGGLWQETSNGHIAGQSIMYSLDKDRYEKYMSYNTCSFICSIGVILFLMGGFFRETKAFLWGPTMLAYIAIMCMIATYGYGTSFQQHNVSIKLLDHRNAIHTMKDFKMIYLSVLLMFSGIIIGVLLAKIKEKLEIFFQSTTPANSV